ESLERYTDVHIDTKLLKGLIPDDEGNRYGFPSLIVLYQYVRLYIVRVIPYLLEEQKCRQ
ncbi:DUF2529 family protein, partial [Bacillus sp. D-CC]